MTGNQAIVVGVTVFALVLFYFAYARPSIGAGGLEIPENMTQKEREKLQEDMENTLLFSLFFTLIIAISAVLGPRIYRRWKEGKWFWHR